VSSGPTVLVADDQTSYREHIAGLLRDAGYEVLLAYDGAQAVRLCKRDLPAVAVIDVVMPITDGIEVCQTLRGDETLPYIPILFVSSRTDPEDVVRGLRAGGDDYFRKPGDDKELLARVEALVRIQQLIANAGDSTNAAAAPGGEAAKDTLTGVWNDGYLDTRIQAELERASRHNEPLSLMVIDIENRDKLGDDALTAGAEAIARCTRAMDVITRCARLSFAVILPNTHFAGAIATADRMWRELAATRVEDKDTLKASIGVACYPNQAVKTGQQLLQFARSALDRALAEGPAHICLYQHQAYIFQPE
jgi:two-component system cell cycle response regulator